MRTTKDIRTVADRLEETAAGFGGPTRVKLREYAAALRRAIGEPSAKTYRPEEVGDAVEAFKCLVSVDRLAIPYYIKSQNPLGHAPLHSDLGQAWLRKRWPALNRAEQASVLLCIADAVRDAVASLGETYVRKAQEEGEM